MAAVEQAYGSIWPGYKGRQLAADFAAYLAMAQDWPSLEDLLPAITIPCCLYAGETDPLHAGVERCSRMIPRAVFFRLPNLGHVGAFTSSDVVLPRVTQFLGVAGPCECSARPAQVYDDAEYGPLRRVPI